MSNSSLVRDRQQEKLLTALRRAQGSELTYDQLREAGIDFPASAVSELQDAGVPVERHYSGGSPQLSFWLDPDFDVSGNAAAPEGDPAPAAPPAPIEAPPAPIQAPPVSLRAAPRPFQTPPPAFLAAAERELQKPAAVDHSRPWEDIRVQAGRFATRAAGVVAAGGADLMARARRTADAAAQRRATAEPTAAAQPRPRRARSGRRQEAPPLTPGRLMSAVALLAAAVTVTVLVMDPFGPSGPASQTAGRHTGAAAATAHRSVSRPQPRSAPVSHRARPAAAKPSHGHTAPSPAAAMKLEAQGHALLEQGQYTAAIQVLQQAAHATGETASACVQPTSQSCLTYAFALYDLGRALRLSGNPAAAVPILQERLQINDARPVVATELQLAQGGAAPSSPGGLEARGHSLLDNGQYASAIPVLQQAAHATGESASTCAQPTSQNCLTYAFALYDLGQALRLSGQPAAAVPILEQRLRINNQHQAVAQELQLAQNASR
jgi:tetratricopeptide (TPR) repeat protein